MGLGTLSAKQKCQAKSARPKIKSARPKIICQIWQIIFGRALLIFGRALFAWHFCLALKVPRPKRCSAKNYRPSRPKIIYCKFTINNFWSRQSIIFGRAPFGPWHFKCQAQVPSKSAKQKCSTKDYLPNLAF